MSVLVIGGGTVCLGPQCRCSLSAAGIDFKHHEALMTTNIPRQLNPK